MHDAPITVPALLEWQARQRPDAPVFSWKADGRTFQTMSYRELWQRCNELAGGLENLGVGPGQWVVMLGDGSGAVAARFWSLVVSVYRLGAGVVCLGGRRHDELIETLARCKPVLLVTESDKTLELAHKAVRETAGPAAADANGLAEALPLGRRPGIVRLEDMTSATATSDTPADPTPASTTTYDAVLATGQAALANGTYRPESTSSVSVDRPCLILLTSGSTGHRKAVPLTPANFWHSYKPAVERIGLTDREVLLQYMPAAHVLSHTLVYGLFWLGACLAFCPADARMIADIVNSGATVLPGPPRLGQVLMTTAEYEIRRRGRLLNWLYRVTQAGSRIWQGWGWPLKGLGWPLHALFVGLFAPQIKARLGRVHTIIFGSAPLPHDVQRWIYTLGVNAINGYGLTEAPVVATSFPAHRRHLGSIGRPFLGSEIKFLDENGRDEDSHGRPLRRGNLCLRGGPVLSEYYGDATSTAESFRDGWFVTGDLACLDGRDELRIEGRIKEIVVPVSGENLAPIPVESAIAGCVFVDQVVVVGDGCKSLGALIVPHFERLRVWARETGACPSCDIDHDQRLIDQPAVREMFTREVKARTTGLDALAVHGGAISRVELLVEAFSVENGLLTPDVRKLRRRAIYERYSAVITRMCG